MPTHLRSSTTLAQYAASALSALRANPGGLDLEELTFAAFGYNASAHTVRETIRYARNNMGSKDRVLIYDVSNNVYKLVTAAGAKQWQQSMEKRAASLVLTSQRASNGRLLSGGKR